MQLLLGNHDPISLSAIQKSVTNLQSKQQDLQKRAREVVTFLEEPYKLPGYQTRKPAVAKSKAPSQSTFIKEIIALVNKDLAVENAKLAQKCKMGEQLLLSKEKELQRLKKNISEFNPRNVRRQIKRKIDKYTKTINHLQMEIKSSKREIIKKLKDQVRYYKGKYDSLMHQLENFECDQCEILQHNIDDLKSENIELLNKNAEYNETIKELQVESSKKLKFYQDGKYIDDLRICIMDLLSHNVWYTKYRTHYKSSTDFNWTRI